MSETIEKMSSIDLDFSNLSKNQILLFKDVDEKKLQSYINKINEIKSVDTGEYFGGFDIGQIQAYADTLKDVDAKQSALLLSTQGLTNAEIQQVLAQQNLTKEEQYRALSNAGLLKTTQKLTIAEIQETLQSKLGSKAKAEEVMKSMGLSVAMEGEEKQTVELTAKKLQLAVASGKVTQAEALELATHLGVDKALDTQNKTSLPQWLANLKSTGSALKTQVVDTINWAKALPLATKALAGVGVGIGTALIAYGVYKNHLEEVRQATEQSATAYKESASFIDDYVSRYKDLHQALQDAKGDEEATANIKQQLLDLQTELNEKYGEEYGKLNLVTDSYRDQTEAIKALNKEEANRFLNENRKGISTATQKMEKEQDYVLSAPTLSVDTPDGKALQEIVDSYTDEGMRLISDDATGAVQIILKADAQTAYETLNDFETDLRNKAKELGNENLFDGILGFSTNALTEVKSVVEKYGDIYNQALMAQLVTDDNASTVYEKALSAVEEYNESVLASEDPFNDTKVAEAKANVEAVMAEAEGLGKFSTIFDDVFDQADTRLLEFNNRLKNDTSLQEWAEQLRGKEIVDLKSMVNDGQDDVFDRLVESAEEYGLEVEEVIDALVRLGYVQGNVTSGEDVFTANTVSLENLNNQIDSIQSAYKGLTTACEEYNQYGYITADTLQTLLAMDSQYLACLINENGQLQINGQTYQALVQAKLADAEATAVQQAIEELGTVTTEQQISADTTAIGVMAQKGTALATLTGQYAALANVAVSAAQAQALADAYTDASSKNKEEADRIMSNLNTKLALIQNTAKNTSGSFGALTNHLNGFSNASGNAKNATDDLTDSIKQQKEALERNKEALKEQKSEMEELHDAVQWFYDKKIDKIDDTIGKINEEIDLLEKQQTTMDDIIKAIENNYDYEISLIQDKIDALQDANTEEQKALELEEAKRKLQEAKSRKTLQVYTKNAGFTYQIDIKAIKEAESELAELQENEVVNELEKQIDALEEAKEKWSQIPNAYNKAMQEIAASNYFGANWKDITLLPSDELLANFEGKYTGIQSSIDSKNDKIDSLEKEKQKLEELKKLWEDAKNSYRDMNYTAKLESFFGSDYEYQLLNNSATWRKKFASEYSSICTEIASVEEQLKSLNEETASSVESGANRISNAANGVKGALENTGNISKYIWTDADTNALEYARQRLDALNQLIGQGKTELTDARDKVANFVDQYSKLEDSRLVTDELKNSVQELNGVYSQSDDYLENMASGVADRLADSKNYTSELVQNTQTTADNLAQVNDQINNLKTSEETIESEADETVSNVETTISNLLTKLGELQIKLGEISLSRTEVEAIADEELLDTSTVVDGVHTKVGEIQTTITTLMESITPLHGALDTLMEKMTTLDEVTLSNVISAFGGASGGEGKGNGKDSSNKSASKGEKGKEGESGGGSGLLGAVKAVDEAIGSVDNEESLLGKLAQVDATKLENIIAQFGLSGENGDSEGTNLLSAVNAVSTAIVGGGKDDENSLIASIEQLGSDPTIEHVTTVSDSFQTLHDTINECIKKVEELSKAIESIPSSTATVGVNGGKASGRAKGGIITKEDRGDLDFVAKSLGEDHMVALSEGEAVVPKETVAKNPEVVNSLLSGQKLDLKSLVNRDIVLQRATPLDTYSMLEKYQDWIVPDSVIMSRLNLPSQDFSKLGVVNNNQKETVVQFNGDIHVHEVQNVDSLSKAIVQQLPNKMTQALSRRDLYN